MQEFLEKARSFNQWHWQGSSWQYLLYAGEMGQRDPVRAIQTHHEMASPWFQKSLGEGRMKRQKGI